MARYWIAFEKINLCSVTKCCCLIGKIIDFTSELKTFVQLHVSLLSLTYSHSFVKACVDIITVGLEQTWEVNTDKGEPQNRFKISPKIPTTLARNN